MSLIGQDNELKGGAGRAAIYRKWPPSPGAEAEVSVVPAGLGAISITRTCWLLLLALGSAHLPSDVPCVPHSKPLPRTFLPPRAPFRRLQEDFLPVFHFFGDRLPGSGLVVPVCQVPQLGVSVQTLFRARSQVLGHDSTQLMVLLCFSFLYARRRWYGSSTAQLAVVSRLGVHSSPCLNLGCRCAPSV